MGTYEALASPNVFSRLPVPNYSLRIEPMTCGYARVSTHEQSAAAQVAELTVAGCEKVFSETASGAKSDRAQLRRAIATLEQGTC